MNNLRKYDEYKNLNIINIPLYNFDFGFLINKGYNRIFTVIEFFNLNGKYIKLLNLIFDTKNEYIIVNDNLTGLDKIFALSYLLGHNKNIKENKKYDYPFNFIVNSSFACNLISQITLYNGFHIISRTKKESALIPLIRYLFFIVLIMLIAIII